MTERHVLPANEPRVTQKNREAIRHYLMHGNKTAAYRHAYDCDNMQPATISAKANEMFNKPHIVAEVMKHQMALAKKFEIEAEDLQKFLLGVARRCMKDKVDKYGNVVPTAPGVSVSAVAELNRMLGFTQLPMRGAPGVGALAGGDDERPVIELDPDDYKRVRLEMLNEDDC